MLLLFCELMYFYSQHSTL